MSHEPKKPGLSGKIRSQETERESEPPTTRQLRRKTPPLKSNVPYHVSEFRGNGRIRRSQRHSKFKSKKAGVFKDVPKASQR